jgi:hypothetical protein
MLGQMLAEQPATAMKKGTGHTKGQKLVVEVSVPVNGSIKSGRKTAAQRKNLVSHLHCIKKSLLTVPQGGQPSKHR